MSVPSDALQGCDMHIAKCLPRDKDAPGIDWLPWLLLADRLQLNRTAACCAVPVVNSLLTGQAKQG